MVADLSFAIPAGTCFGLLGPNGAKTTTLRLCLGLTAPDAGTVRLAGLPFRRGPPGLGPGRRGAGSTTSIPISPSPRISLVFGRYFGLADAAVRARMPQLLEFAGLAGKGRPASPPCRGHEAAPHLARALVNDPAIVFSTNRPPASIPRPGT